LLQRVIVAMLFESMNFTDRSPAVHHARINEQAIKAKLQLCCINLDLLPTLPPTQRYKITIGQNIGQRVAMTDVGER